MKALILAAGYATRLYPLTRTFPKSLLSVKGRPIIDYIVDKLENVEELLVVTNHKFQPQFEKWRLSHEQRQKITLVDDLTRDNGSRLGAVGDMGFVIEKKNIDEDLFVVGGDNLFERKLDDFLSASLANKPSPTIGVFDIKDRGKANKYGVVELDKDKRVMGFQEKPDNPKSTLVAMCLYFFPKETLKLVKEYLAVTKGKYDAMGFYVRWLSRKVPVFGFLFDGNWYDIGDHEFYNAAKEKFA